MAGRPSEPRQGKSPLRSVTSAPWHADPPDLLSVNTLAGPDHVTANGVAGVLQVLVDGAAV